MNGSENPGVVVKAEDGVNLSEVRKKSNLANVVIEKSNVVDEVMEKTGIVNEVEDMLSMMDDLTGNPNIVNEKSGLGNKATEKTSVVDEVTEKANITDDAMQNPKLVSTANVSRPIIGERDNYLNGIAHMESVRSKNDQSGINTTVTYNIDSNVVSEVDRKDKTICAPDLIEDEKVDYAPGTITGSEIKMENQSEDFVVEHVKTGIINKVDVELLAGENVSPIREKNVVLDGAKSGRMFGKAESSSEVESDCIRSTEGLLLSGEMEALERKKRRKTEIFLRGLDKDMKEDDIRKTFGEAGPIVEVRLLMSKRGKSRGFAFVRFATYADAKNALEKYSKICGKQCTAAPVEGNDTIFLGNIDRNWKTEDVMTLVEKAGVLKIDKITIKADPDNFDKNRGFAFVELQTSKDAQIAFNKLQKKNAFGKNQTVKVSWALPLTEPNDEEISRVKSVYAEYLPSSWDEEKVKDYFKRFGEIENIVLAKDLPSSRRKDFAFINYTARDAALMCIEAVSRERLEDDCSKVKMAVSLAKPISKRKQMKHTSDKHLSKAKQKAFQKLHEPRDKGKPPRTSYYHKKVDKKPSTTDELVQILRQQASTKHIPSQPRTGTTVSDHHFSLPGSKRPFSLVGHDPLYVECQGFSELRVERSYPIPGPSSSSYGVELLSFPYHHRQGPSVASESGSAREIYPNHFQAREQAPYYADNNIYRRCE